MGRVVRRPSPAMIVAITALVSSFAGPAIADQAATIAAKVNGSKIKNRSISGNKLKNNTITGKQVNEGTLGKVPSAGSADSATNATNATNAVNATKAKTADSATTAGVAGQGYTAVNSTSATNALSSSVTVPAGDYVASGSCSLSNGPNSANVGSVDTALTSDNDTGHNVTGYVSVPTNGWSFLSTYGNAEGSHSTGFHLPAGGTITMSCTKDAFSQQGSVTIQNAQVAAVQVANLNG